MIEVYATLSSWPFRNQKNITFGSSVSYAIDKFIFFQHTHAQKTLLIIFLLPSSIRSFIMIYRGGKMKEKQKLAVHYAALGKEDDGFSQSNFLQSEIWYKDLDYVCQCWEGTQTCETIIYNQRSQDRGHYWVLEMKSISKENRKDFFTRVRDSNIWFNLQYYLLRWSQLDLFLHTTLGEWCHTWSCPPLLAKATKTS